jgi:hypothetical protein
MATSWFAAAASACSFILESCSREKIILPEFLRAN